MPNEHRLGGIPLGVIAVETRTVELTIPADPANLDSESKVSIFCILYFVLFKLIISHCFTPVLISGPAAGRPGVVSRFSLQNRSSHF